MKPEDLKHNLPAEPFGGLKGDIASGREIVLTKKETQMLLNRLNKWNDDGLLQLKNKLTKWSLIRNYIHGNDWSDRTGGRLTAAQRLIGNDGGTGNVDMEPHVNNVMMRIHMSNMQRIGRFQPAIEVEPEDNSLKSKQAARRGKIYLNDLLDKVKYKRRLRRKIDRIIALYGSVYIKVMIDPNDDAQEVVPKLDAFGKLIGVEKNEDGEDNDGIVQMDAVPPKNIILPPYCSDPIDADWMIENNIRSTDYALRKYGKTVKSEQISSIDVKWWRMGLDQDRAGDGADKDSNLCIIHEAFIERSVQFPLGAHIIWAGNEILKSTTMDDYYFSKPYFKAEFIYDDEDPDGETPYWYMIPAQNSLNRVETDIRSHAVMMCKPKWQQHQETIIEDPDGITNETAQVLKWTGPVAPGIILAPELPQTVFTWREMLMGEMMSLGAAHDIVRPSTPRSGTAIAYEQEQDDTTLAPTIDSLAAAHEAAFSFALRLKSQYIPTKRRYSYRNERGLVISDEFGGDDLCNSFKVRCNMQSGLPSNKIARQQLVVQLKNQGIITAEMAQRFFEFGEADEALQKTLISYERAQKFVELLEAGGLYEAMPAMPFDDHAIMLAEIKSACQERWEEWPDHVKQQFIMALQQHGAAAAAKAQAMVAGAEPGASRGVPGEMPMSPPGMPEGGQVASDQPMKPEGQSNSIYDMPGMADGAPPQGA